MQSFTTPPASLRVGTFVRVRDEHEDWTRAGRDGMVASSSAQCLGLIFGTDRHGRDQGTRSVGIEAWDAAELDLTRAEF